MLNHINDIRVISLDLVNFIKNISDINIDSYEFLCTQVASFCINYLGTILMMPTSIKASNFFKEYDNEIKHLSETVYKKIDDLDGILPKSISLLRKTNSLLYWFFSFARQFV